MVRRGRQWQQGRPELTGDDRTRVSRRDSQDRSWIPPPPAACSRPLLLALLMYGRLPGLTAAPRHVRASHRIVGWAAFLLSIPVAYHCVRTYGVETTDTRVFLHSVAGCALYGAFVAKVLVVRSRRLPAWMLSAAGSLLFGLIGLLWYSAAPWALNGFNAAGL
ncbi:DUF6529 family protein [Streptomyces sp. NPDC014776]|uniref:DUF6529 family protein n=1 Tax=unclassified Streptomyces TaxID=2593676 RepID=UPI00370027D7